MFSVYEEQSGLMLGRSMTLLLSNLEVRCKEMCISCAPISLSESGERAHTPDRLVVKVKMTWLKTYQRHSMVSYFY